MADKQTISLVAATELPSVQSDFRVQPAAHKSVLPAHVRDEVFEHMEQGIMVWSGDGICRLLNSRYYELLDLSLTDVYEGLSRIEHLQRSAERGEIPLDRVEEIEALYQRRQPFSYDRNVGKDRIVFSSIRPLREGGHVATFTDVTESRKRAEELARAIKRAEAAEQQAMEALKDQQRRQESSERLSEFNDWLQSCKSVNELYSVVEQAFARLFPGSRGQLFVYSHSRDVLDGAAAWGGETLLRSIQPHDCWSLRRGRTFNYGSGLVNLPCDHVDADGLEGCNYLCLPVIAHGDTVGLLHIRFDNVAEKAPVENSMVENSMVENSTVENETVHLAQRCAEMLSIAIANVQLRDELHEQSTRDPLTGLFNRRFFHERARSTLAMVGRENSRVGLIVFDADDFKHYNDQYGHDAGDKVLCIIAELMRKQFTGAEICARIGGEEFAILVPGSSAAALKDTANSLVSAVWQQEMSFLNQPLPNISISAGIASYPDDADDLPQLIRHADKAMYAAKDSGKNRVGYFTAEGGEPTVDQGG